MGRDPVFAIDFDFVDHRLIVTTHEGSVEGFALPGNSVASFYEQTLSALSILGIELTIERPEPFDLADDTPFADDFHHHDYDAMWINRTGGSSARSTSYSRSSPAGSRARPAQCIISGTPWTSPLLASRIDACRIRPRPTL